ncbi:hypothetical protein LTS18_000717 [Coniosporium uncinatum]|uniref:Uncharacterized protein n=1 Tax=Coniosporium uncinatum TaxID=93489 RepID=A0ACC3D8J9_9PEZI|nr:hypothetical protein LTS18_000717 [Coniosporium uncinatum]
MSDADGDSTMHSSPELFPEDDPDSQPHTPLQGGITLPPTSELSPPNSQPSAPRHAGSTSTATTMMLSQDPTAASPTRMLNENGKRALRDSDTLVAGSSSDGNGNGITIPPSTSSSSTTPNPPSSSLFSNLTSNPSASASASYSSNNLTTNAANNDSTTTQNNAPAQTKTHKSSNYTWTRAEDEPGYSWRNKRAQEDMQRCWEQVVGKEVAIGARYGDMLVDKVDGGFGAVGVGGSGSGAGGGDTVMKG